MTRKRRWRGEYPRSYLTSQARLLVRRTCFREVAVQSPHVKSGWTPMGIGSGGWFVRLRRITFPRLPLVCLCSFGRLFCRRSTSRVLSPYADRRAHASASAEPSRPLRGEEPLRLRQSNREHRDLRARFSSSGILCRSVGA